MPPTAFSLGSFDPVSAKIEAWRDALIDLSRRNPLLSLPTRSVVPIRNTADSLWRLPEKGTKCLQLVTEKLPNDTIRALKANELAFVPNEFRAISNLRLRARASLSEQGVNILFIALGVLEWQEPGRTVWTRSPLLLLPVALEKMEGDAGFVLSRFPDDIRLNPTLRFRLGKPDIGITLPESYDDNTPPSTFLEEISTLIQVKQPEWRVNASECLLGRFSYLNLAMYGELGTRLYEARNNPLIAAIAGDVVAKTELPRSVPQPLDTELPSNSFSVLPADPSQEQAIYAGRAGNNLVIQGPPGTGKTQTITNLIATYMADGKRVLFVSEKKAALEAVYKRLQEHGLHLLCLEAHGHKAGKTEILGQLRHALEVRNTKRRGKNVPDAGVLRSVRDEIKSAVDSLHERREPLGKSLYEAREIVAELQAVPNLSFALPDTQEIDADVLYRMETLSERLAAYAELFEEWERHPWLGVQADVYTQTLHLHLQAVLSEWIQTLTRLQEQGSSLARLFELPDAWEDTLTISAVEKLERFVERFVATPRPPTIWFTNSAEDEQSLRRIATASMERYRRFRFDKKALLEKFAPGILGLPHNLLIEGLTVKPHSVLFAHIGTGWADKPDDFLADTAEACNRVTTILGGLMQSCEQLVRLTGVASPDSIAAVTALIQSLDPVQTDTKPQADWFLPNATVALATLAEETQATFKKRDNARAIVAEAFTEELYTLPIDDLSTRFITEYESWLRIFKGTYWQDRKSLKKVAVSDTAFRAADVTDLLKLACVAKTAQEKLVADQGTCQRSFGVHYAGEKTDWQKLDHNLSLIRTLCANFSGALPEPLKATLVASGVRWQEMQQQWELVRTQLGQAEAALKHLALFARIPSDESRPTMFAPFSTLIAESAQLRDMVRDFLATRQKAQSVVLHTLPTAEMVVGLETAARLVDEEKSIAEEALKQRERYAHLFEGLDTDWEQVLLALSHAETLKAEWKALTDSSLTPSVLAMACEGDLQGITKANERARQLRNEALDYATVWRKIAPLFDFNETYPALAVSSLLSEQQKWATTRIHSLARLEQWLLFQAVRKECDGLGMTSFCETVIASRLPGKQVAPVFRKIFYQRWMEAASAQSPEVSTLCAAEHTPRQAKFVLWDKAYLEETPRRILAQAQERRELTHGLSNNIGEVGYLNRLLQQKKPRASVRKILGEIPNLIFRLTPCLMMSPLSVSLFLDPDRISFDVVIFDEASQVFPQSALGSLLRAEQAIFAGDSRQLPPTAFFQKLQDSDSDSEDEDDVQIADPNEFESVLDAASAAFETRNLNWHYRSHHESLIQFSNENIYNKGLYTFPSASVPSQVRFVHVPDGRYYGGAGNKRDNPVEAKRVAELVIEQVRERPWESLGIITMSEAQTVCIRAAIERETLLDASLAKLLDEDAKDNPDHFFIKPIEEVQGDERDAIFLSVGYGKWASDDKVRMSFGPLNTRSERSPSPGERRLNVAVTRAKERMTVVSSMEASDIPVDVNSPGAKLLRKLLSYARDNSSSLQSSEAESEDGVVEAVAQALERRGHLVRRAIGTAQYRIDLAIVDPDDPQTFALGIECDGDNYRDGETVRAREWLRTSVLHGLKWRMHRIWSADWLRNPDAVLHGIEKALRGEEESIPEPVPTTIVSVDTEETETVSGVDTYMQETDSTGEDTLLPGLTYFKEMTDDLPGWQDTLYGSEQSDAIRRAEFVWRVIEQEQPIHRDFIALRLSRAAGLSRTGAQIQRIAEEALSLLRSADQIAERNEFLVIKDTKSIPARVPCLGDPPRSIHHVSIEEIGEIALAVIRSGIGMRISEAITETARQMGYKNTGVNVRERIENAIAQLEYDNRIHNFGEQLRALGMD